MTTRADQPDAAAGSPEQVRLMFDQIVPRYDLLNHLLSGGLDIFWRRRAARFVCAHRPSAVIDLCCGTGDLACCIARRLSTPRAAHVPAAAVVGLDFSPAMIKRACRKYSRQPNLSFIIGDALAVGLADASADAVTCAFGLRNVADVQAFIAEALRLLRPGGRLVVLEFFKQAPGVRQALFSFYFRRIVPILGRCVSGHRSAYDYLPSSVERFISAPQLADAMSAAGMNEVQIRPLPGGAATMVSGAKAADGEGGCT